jgi:cytochrome c oxidase assembly factor CtaG
MPALILIALLLGGTEPAWAHQSEALDDRAAWTFDPFIAGPLVVFALLYSIGLIRLARRRPLSRVLTWRIAAGCSGWLVLAGALISPLHWLGEHLFTFHMIEHEIMMAIAAPLLVIARPVGLVLWGLPRGLRQRVAAAMRWRPTRTVWQMLTLPAAATLIHAAAIWGWHVPSWFDAAVENVTLHRLQHVSFFATAVLFWWAVVWRCTRGAAAWHVFVTMLHTSALGALMAMVPRVLYTTQTLRSSEWGLTPLEDQQLAGLVMWIPAGTIYAGCAIALMALWITQAKHHAHRVSDAVHV